MRSASGNARPAIVRAYTTLNIAALRPMPSASTTMAATVKPGDFRRCRTETFRSPMAGRDEREGMVVPQISRSGELSPVQRDERAHVHGVVRPVDADGGRLRADRHDHAVADADDGATRGERPAEDRDALAAHHALAVAPVDHHELVGRAGRATQLAEHDVGGVV